MVATKKVIMYLIPLIVLVITSLGYFGDNGLFAPIKELGDDIKDAAPNVSAGMQKLKADDVEIPGEIGVQLESFKAAIEEMLNSSNTNCFGNYQSFSDLDADTNGWFSDPKSVTIRLSYDPSRRETLFVIDTGIGQQYELYNLSMDLCVVGGKERAGLLPTERFFRHFISADRNDVNLDFSNPLTSLEIFFDDEGFNGNIIRVLGDGFTAGEHPINDEPDNYESGYLYKQGDKGICFLPTNYLNDYDEDGVENDWIQKPNLNGNVWCGYCRSLAFRLLNDPFDPVQFCRDEPIRTDYDFEYALEYARGLDQSSKYGANPGFIDHFSVTNNDCARCGSNSNSFFNENDWDDISGNGWFDVEEEMEYVADCLARKRYESPGSPLSVKCHISMVEYVTNYVSTWWENLDIGEAVCDALPYQCVDLPGFDPWCIC